MSTKIFLECKYFLHWDILKTHHHPVQKKDTFFSNNKIKCRLHIYFNIQHKQKSFHYKTNIQIWWLWVLASAKATTNQNVHHVQRPASISLSQHKTKTCEPLMVNLMYVFISF